MKKNIIFLIAILIILAASGLSYFILKNQSPKRTAVPPVATTPTTIKPTPTSQTSSPNQLTYPINQFKERITKKPFGIYITPKTSPIQPERFTGYHTGTDIEYQDITIDIPVYAINDGVITLARTASGYGGVMILSTDINGQKHSVVYGHIRPTSLPVVGQLVKKGETIGLLGTGYSAETDGERRHLHFEVLSDDRTDLLGYVQSKNGLSGWIDPTTLY